MDKKAIVNVEKVVMDVLAVDMTARDNDDLLYLLVIARLGYNTNAPIHEFFTMRAKLGLPSFETVSRTRRKLQSMLPELRASFTATKAREESERAFYEYAIG